MTRKIIHIDMDAFYASVEQMDNPALRGKPIVVGRAEGRGVVAAASYEARHYGIRSAMPSAKAKQLCADVIFVNIRMERYKEISRAIHNIFHEYTDLIEPISLDEAFLDVTVNKKGMNLAIDIAREIKESIKSRIGLTASAGISYNKMLAKIASDYRKPNGLYLIHPLNALKFIETLPIEAIWGVGKVTEKKMHALGIFTGGQLRACSLEFLTRNFGKSGKLFYDFSRGNDSRQVEAYRERKSVACEYTFEKDVRSKADLLEKLQVINQDLNGRLERADFQGKTLTLKIRFHDFSQITRSVSVPKALRNENEIHALAVNLLDNINIENAQVRLMGLSISNPIHEKENRYGKQLRIEFEEYL